jgi:hypothetical protein
LRDNGQWVYGNKKASKELKASEKIEQEETVNNGRKKTK